MKTLRNITVLVGFSLVLFALGVAGAKAQGLHTPDFGGTFTLPFAAQWGGMTLPAGEYTLRYGQINAGGSYAVQIAGKEKGSPHGLVLAAGRDEAAAEADALVCVRNGNGGIVRELQLASIGQKVSFAMPHGARVRSKVIAAQTTVPIERAPVTLTAR